MILVLSIFSFTLFLILDKINLNQHNFPNEIEDQIMGKVDDKIFNMMKELDKAHSSVKSEDEAKKTIVQLEKNIKNSLKSSTKISNPYDHKDWMDDISYPNSASTKYTKTAKKFLEKTPTFSDMDIPRHLQLERTLPFCSDSVFFFHTHLDIQDPNTNVQLRDDTSDNVYELQPISNQNTTFRNTYSACLLSGIFFFDITYGGGDGSPCANVENCYDIFINDTLIIQGDTFSDAASYSFFISNQGIVRERLCHKLPMLSSVNRFDSFIQSEREDNIVTKLISVSSLRSLSNHRSPQYKAACWILFDDELQISSENSFLIERYVLALMFYSMSADAELFIPLNICNADGIQCDDEGLITQIKKGELFKTAVRLWTH